MHLIAPSGSSLRSPSRIRSLALTSVSPVTRFFFPNRPWTSHLTLVLGKVRSNSNLPVVNRKAASCSVSPVRRDAQV